VILLVTSAEDLTTDYLIKRLEERRLSFFRFNTEETISSFDISLSLAATTQFSITDLIRGVELKSSNVSGAYFRRPGQPRAASEDETECMFNRREIEETLRSLWRMIPEGVWLNHPERIWFANNKIKQLMLAREVGFHIPDTLVSSKSEDVLEFIGSHENDCISKPVKHGFFNSDNDANLIFTDVIQTEQLSHLRSCSQIVPAIVQPRLEKKLDLRITVVGESVFPVAIYSQEHTETTTDWRTWDITEGIDLKHEQFNLPTETRESCLALNRRLGLNFSCIDMVLTTKDSLVFLEVNPNGQWAWIESLADFPIRDAIIDRLTRSK
jgi:glutathione synthase/RimK-type ligase-like ATP-grasp enzyme